MKIRNKIFNFFRNILLIIGFVFVIVITILSCGLLLIVFDYVKQDENDEYSNLDINRKMDKKE